MGKVDPSVLNVPAGGHSHTVRQSMVGQTDRPVPGGGRPRPKPRNIKKLAQVRALYDYDAQENDEISIKAGDKFELVREGNERIEVFGDLEIFLSRRRHWMVDRENQWRGRILSWKLCGEDLVKTDQKLIFDDNPQGFD